ncbi:MAG: hypothetical protein SRB2_03334 [Desulfobacteraceae bacterium Eth-SRB2]|nr:MAG: hypothetical protein SRB2_03334 [Desulfobacteraceae bacterium Eth-SRB2]
MKVLRLYAEKVYGHLNLSIEFNSDITFLTGKNGSGKTTVLRLILALVTPSLRDLDLIPHDSATLALEYDRKEYSVKSQLTEDSVTLSVSDIDEKLKFNKLDYDQYDGRPGSAKRTEEHYSLLEDKLSDHPVIKFLTQIETPTFLGLERRQRESAPPLRTYPIRGAPRRRTPFRGTLGASLHEIQGLVQNYFRRIRMQHDKINDKLKEEILLSTFQYEPFQKQLPFSDLDLPKWQDMELINSKRKDMEETLVGLGIDQNRFRNIIGDFFDQLGRLVSEEIDKESHEFIEWIINKPQIDRITRIFKIVDDYNEKVSNLFAPVERFLSLVNGFFTDSGKNLGIDSVGWLEVRQKDQDPKSIESLSSGERQIVVILAHLFISEQMSRTGLFIVDEPELSLHLKWQEIFVDSLLEASPSTQFILATHSPSIVLDRQDNFLSIGD